MDVMFSSFVNTPPSTLASDCVKKGPVTTISLVWKANFFSCECIITYVLSEDSFASPMYTVEFGSLGDSAIAFVPSDSKLYTFEASLKWCFRAR